MIKLTIPGPPKGKGRPRFSGGHAYTPVGTREYEDLVRLAWAKAGRETAGAAPVSVSITAWHQVPKSAPRNVKALMEHGFRLPCVKPDADNIAKVICDALNGLAYKDDAQIVRLEVIKAYSAEEPRVEVEIVELDTAAEPVRC